MAEIKYFLNADDAQNFLKIKRKFMRNNQPKRIYASLSKTSKEDKSLTIA